MRKRKKTAARKVSFEKNDDDFLVAVLAAMGYSTACIAFNTGLTQSQVNYRISVAGLQWARHNFRNGTSKQALNNLQEFLDMDRGACEDVALVIGDQLDATDTKGKKIKPKGGRK